MLHFGQCFLLKWRLGILGILYLHFQAIKAAPAATGVNVAEIQDGQIQVPVSVSSAVSLFKATGSIYPAVLNTRFSTTQSTIEAGSNQTTSRSFLTVLSLPTSSSCGHSTEAISNTSLSSSVTPSEMAGQIMALVSTLANSSISRPPSTTPPSSGATSETGPHELLVHSSSVSNIVFNPQNLLITATPSISNTSVTRNLQEAFFSNLSSSFQFSPTQITALILPGSIETTRVQGQIVPSPTISGRNISQVSNASLITTSIAMISRVSSASEGLRFVTINSTQNGSSPLLGHAYQLPSLATSNTLVQQTVTGGKISITGPSSSALAGLLVIALAQGQSSTITTIPPGMSIETLTTKTCSTAGAMVTKTATGSTVAQVVPELCDNGLAFLFFGWAKIPQLCDARLGLFGFLLQFICDTKLKLPYGFDLISIPSSDPNTPEILSPESPNISPPSPQDGDKTPTTLPQASKTYFRTSMMSSASVTTLPQASETYSQTSMMSSAPVVVDTWIDEMYDFLTTSVSLPSKASAVYMTDVPTSVNNATLASFFSSIYTEMMSAAGVAQLNATASVISIASTKPLNVSSGGATTASESSGLVATITSTFFPTVSPTPSPDPDCIYEIAAEYHYPVGTEDYCYCPGGIYASAAYAPLLTHSATGPGFKATTDCSYSTQPVPGWTPSITGIWTTKNAANHASSTVLASSSKSSSLAVPFCADTGYRDIPCPLHAPP